MRSLCLIAVLALAGCGGSAPATAVTPPPVNHPGAANAFDSNAYDALVSAQAAIANARTTITINYPKLIPQLNGVMASYNATLAAYLVYHEAVTNNVPADDGTLKAQIAGVTASVASLVAQVAGASK